MVSHISRKTSEMWGTRHSWQIRKAGLGDKGTRLLSGRFGLGFVIQGVDDFAWLGIAQNDSGFMLDGIGI